jgi:predicted KAP-like P-loop ATPase
LKEVISSDSEGKLEKPMFVFIDELDRCRPTYAIELLETVKHLFDIPDLIFVIATDTEQLQHSVKSVYGEGFDASRYLYRFFNRSFSLKKPDVLEFIKYSKSI